MNNIFWFIWLDQLVCVFLKNRAANITNSKTLFMSRTTTVEKCLFENDDFWFKIILKPNNWFHLQSPSIQMKQQLIKILWFEPNCFLEWKSPFVQCKRVDIQFSPSFDWTHPETFMRSNVIGCCHLRSEKILDWLRWKIWWVFSKKNYTFPDKAYMHKMTSLKTLKNIENSGASTCASHEMQLLKCSFDRIMEMEKVSVFLFVLLLILNWHDSYSKMFIVFSSENWKSH